MQAEYFLRVISRGENPIVNINNSSIKNINELYLIMVYILY